MCEIGSRPERYAIALLVLCLAVGLWSPNRASAGPRSPDTTAAPQKYWIFLEDRPTRSAPSPEARWTRSVAPSFLARLRDVGVRPLLRSRWFHAVSARLSVSRRDTVVDLPFVRFLRPVATLRPATASSPHPDPSAGDSPRSLFSLDRKNSFSLGASRNVLSRISAVAPLERGLDGHGVRVGFLDAHFGGLRHPAFSALRADGRLAALRTFTEGRQSGTHGAGVVSVAAGYAPGALLGPAYGATVLGATTEYTRFERNVEEDHFVAGLEWLHRRGAEVVNVSIGYTRFDEGEHSYTPDDLDGDTALTTRAVDRAAHLGVTVVVSAGNSGCDDPDSCWSYVNTPADADSAIAVGAVLPDSSLAPFSARGPTADGRRKPDVVVQGRDVVAAWSDGQYAQVGGTSFASPQVTGIVAQMLQVNPTLEPMEIRQLLRQTASRAHTPDSTYGWGIVNAEAALRRAEWRARRNPPASLRVTPPHRPPGDPSLVAWAFAPARTSTLRTSLRTPLGRRVIHREQSGHPGPNRLVLDVQDVPPGVYRYRVQTDAGSHTTARVTIPE